MARWKWHLNYANSFSAKVQWYFTFCLLCSWPHKPDFFMLIHREVAMHTNERRRNVCVTHMCGWEREHAHVYACMGVSLRVCLLAINGCGVHGGSPPKRKMNRSGRVMWLSRPFRFNYELITRHDHSAGKRAGSWGGETKENNNWEKIEGWKVLVKPFSQHVGRCQKTNKKKNSRRASSLQTLSLNVGKNITHRHLTCSYTLPNFYITGWFKWSNNFVIFEKDKIKKTWRA